VLEEIAANYKRVAGFQVEAINARPPIVIVPGTASHSEARTSPAYGERRRQGV